MEVEKLCRLLETLTRDASSAASSDGNSSPGGPNSSSKRPAFIRRRTLSKYPSVREEKIHLCNALADSLLTYSATKSVNKETFPELLGLALDGILTCCNDSDANTRLSAEEVLNRVLQDHIDAHPVTVLVDLFKHVKRGEEARIVKISWSRFSHFAVYIRPQRFRCRAFILNLIPCILQLSRRDEDLVHEALSEGLSLVLKALGPFITETEIRSLVRAFLPNLSSDSSVKRRAAAAAVVELCLQSRKPEQALEWLLRGLLGLVRTSADNASSVSFCGILLAVKNALSAGLESTDRFNIPVPLTVQILTTLLNCCSHSDHNVQGFALETLHVFLRRLDGPVRDIFCEVGGLAHFQHSPGDSGDSFEFGRDEEDRPDTASSERKESETLDPENFGSVDNPMLGRKRDSVGSASDHADTVSILSSAMSEDVLDAQDMEPDDGDVFQSGNDDSSPLTELADTFSETAFTDREREPSLGSDEQLDAESLALIGSLHDTARSGLEYVARFISAKFLLKNTSPPQIRASVRVSVQSLALACLTDLVNLDPSLLFKARFTDDPVLPETCLADACAFLEHSDPLLRAHGSVLACLLVSGSVNPLFSVPSGLPVDIQATLRQTAGILRQESPAACRLAVEALERCMEVFLFTEDAVEHALTIVVEVVGLLADGKVSYWLLKTELLRFLRAVPFTHLFYAEAVFRNVNASSRKRPLKDTVLQCLLSHLAHDDQRIRQAAAETLCWMPYSFGLPVLVSQQTYSVLRAGYEKQMKAGRGDLIHSLQTGLSFPYNAHEFPRFVSGVEDCVALLVGRLFDLLICSTKKDQIMGIISSLCLLSRVYPTSSFSRSWFGVIEDSDLAMERYTSPSVGLLSRILEIMNSLSFASDLLLHAYALELSGNLFAGLSMAVYSVRVGRPDGLIWSHLGCHGLRVYAEAFSRHLARLLNITKATTEGQKSGDVFSSSKSLLSASPGQSLSLRRRNDSYRHGETKKSKHGSLDLKNRANLGSLATLDVFAGLMDAIKKAYHRHRTHLSHDANSDRFQQLVKSTLVSWSQLLEMTSSEFMAPHTDEIMRYLRVTMVIEGQASVYCIEQLLRCLFGCNLAQMDSGPFLKDIRSHFAVLPSKLELLVSFSEQSPVGAFLPRFRTMPARKSAAFDGDDWRCRWNAHLENHRVDSLEILFKSYTKEKRVIMSDTIRQFESVVIKSLQLYTCTIKPGAQMQVLDLLVLLLQLHVNYNVLDGEHVFLKYILKQLELLEMGQIVCSGTGQRHLLYLFRFLIHLSHDKVIFQQNILTYGHIMQYCDSLMHMAAPSQKMVLSILRLLFNDTLHRKLPSSTPITIAATAGQEAERDAQMEVILSTALRCLPEPNALDVIHKFLLHQLARSAGLYETHVRDLVEGTFLRISAAGLSGVTCLSSFGKDYDKISRFLSIVGCHELLQAQAFLNFFADLVQQVQVSSESNLVALLFFSAVIEQFVSNGVIEPLLKLFHLSDQNHPLEDPLAKKADVSAQAFALVINQIFDGLFESNTCTTIEPNLQQVLDFIYCSLLSTLTSFVHMVDQGPVKTVLREIQSTNRLDHSERRHINTACRVAWLQFRFAATGCDLEPRFWNKGIKLPIEDHICEVVWALIRPEREQSEEARRLVSDISCDDASSLELSLVSQAYSHNALALLQQVLSSCHKDDDQVVLRWLLQLYAKPRGAAVQYHLLDDLKRLSSLPDTPRQRHFSGADSEPVHSEEWQAEKPSPLKQLVSSVWKVPDTRRRHSSSADSENSDIWLQSLARRVALASDFDTPAAIASLLGSFDEETVMTIVSDQRFSVALLRDCLKPLGTLGTSLEWSTVPGKFSALFYAARSTVLQEISLFIGLDLTGGDGVDEWRWLMLTGAFVEFGERVNDVEADLPLESMDDFLQLILIGFRNLSRWTFPRLLRRRLLQALLLCLENSSFMSWLSDQPESTISDLIEEIHSLLVEPRTVLEASETSFQEDKEALPVSQDDLSAMSPLQTRITQLAAMLDDTQSSLAELEAQIILGLSRLALVAEIVRIPPSAYSLGWSCKNAAGLDPIPIELLQELPVLKDFVSRVCRYGWLSKRQFEETWMAFLSVLSCVPIEEESDADEAQHQQTLSSRIAAGRVALRCITALLLESVLAPRPGNPLRSRGLPKALRSPGRQLDDFSEVISSRKMTASTDVWVTHFLCRPRRASYFHYTHFDGLDQLYCRWVMKGSPQAGGGDSQVDLRSCLKFVMDLYSHWTSDERLKKLSPYILDEVVKSTLHISNIFHDEKNFRWMYGFVRQVLRIKNVEESLFYGHLIDGLGKALSMMDEDKEGMSTLRKAAEGRATQSLMNRVSSSRMLLRLFRQQTAGEPGKALHWLQNLATALYEFECRTRIRSGDLLDLLFTIFVSQIDFFTPKPKETINPFSEVLLNELRGASSLSFPMLNNLVTVLGRYLVDKRVDDGVFREQLVKTGLNVVNLPPPRSLSVLGLLLTCLDPDTRGGQKLLLTAEDNSPSIADSHSDPLFVMAMEKMGIVKQRRGKCFVVESQLLGQLYLQLLIDKTPLSEAINRVMAEFQSCPASSAPFVAELVAKVFGLLKKHRLDAVVDEWIALSLGNFANRIPSGLGIWSLTCLFCAASSGPLSLLFPFIRLRCGVYDDLLGNMFIHSGLSFVRDIEVSETGKIVFKAVAAAAGTSDVMERFYQQLVLLFRDRQGVF